MISSLACEGRKKNCNESVHRVMTIPGKKGTDARNHRVIFGSIEQLPTYATYYIPAIRTVVGCTEAVYEGQGDCRETVRLDRKENTVRGVSSNDDYRSPFFFSSPSPHLPLHK